MDLPQQDEALLEKPSSEATAQLTDEGVRALISTTHARTLDLLSRCREQVDKASGATERGLCWGSRWPGQGGALCWGAGGVA